MQLNYINVVDNIVSEKLQDEIEEVYVSSFFPWNYFEHSVGVGEYKMTDNTYDTSFFSHTHYKNGRDITNYIPDVKNIPHLFAEKNKINIRNINRIRANLTRNFTDYKECNHSAIHRDWNHIFSSDSPLMFCSLLYYVNDSDGDTKFFDENYNQIESVTPKKGRAVFFNSNILHAGSNPIKNNIRIVINYTLEIER